MPWPTSAARTATRPPASTMPMTLALSRGKAKSPAAQRTTAASTSTVTRSPGWMAATAAGQVIANSPLFSALR